MKQALSYDLHIHSCLSPCGDDDMTPGNIVGMSALKGLDVIALTDHNSCKNCAAAMKHGQDFGVTVIPGMELPTMEEVHVLCLFPTLEAAMDFDAYVYEHLAPVTNCPELFGKQQIVNEDDLEIGTVEKLLIGATDIPFSKVAEVVSSYAGITFPAHIDKSSTSLLSNLGFIPPDSTFVCAEFHNLDHVSQIKSQHPYLEKVRFLCNSDAHYLQDIHEAEYFLHSESPRIPDILKSLTEPKKEIG